MKRYVALAVLAMSCMAVCAEIAAELADGFTRDEIAKFRGIMLEK